METKPWDKEQPGDGGAGQAKALTDHARARAMVFVENGRVVDRRSMMRAGTIADIFWGVLNTIYCFFHCMLSVCWPAPLPRVRPHPRAARAAAGRTPRMQSMHGVCSVCGRARLRLVGRALRTQLRQTSRRRRQRRHRQAAAVRVAGAASHVMSLRQHAQQLY